MLEVTLLLVSHLLCYTALDTPDSICNNTSFTIYPGFSRVNSISDASSLSESNYISVMPALQ
jgi:hypothetical protein